MTSKNATIFYHLGGNIVDDPLFGVSYEGGQNNCFRVKQGTTFRGLLNKLYAATGLSVSSHNITMTCRFPTYFGPGHCYYRRMRIVDDESVDVMISTVIENPGLPAIDIYLDIEAVTSRTWTAGDVVRPVAAHGSVSRLLAPSDEHPLYPDISTTSRQYGAWGTDCIFQTSQPEYNFGSMPGCSSQFTQYQPSNSQLFSPEFQRPVARNEHMESQAPETSFDAAISLAQRGIDSPVRESREEIHDDIEDEQIIEAIDNGFLNDVDQEDGYEIGQSSSPPHVMEPISAFFTDTSGFDTSDGWMQPSVKISVYDPVKNNLQKCQLFKSNELLQHAVRKYSVDEKKEIKVGTTNSHRWEVFCKLRDSTGCLWRLLWRL